MNTTPDDRSPAVAGPVDWPVRPDCWDFAMDFLGDPEASAVEAYVAGLEAEVARLRAELARCGGDNCMGRRCDDVTNWVTEQAAQARVAAERERHTKQLRSWADKCDDLADHADPHTCALLRDLAAQLRA